LIVVKKIKLSKKSNGLKIYTYKTYTKQFSFMVTPYENISNNYYKTTTELTFKGEKSFCIYCNNNASENETKVIKQLAPKSMTYKHKNFYTKEKKNNFFFILILDLSQQFFLNIFLFLLILFS